MVRAAGQQAQRAWEVEAAGGEVGEARVQLPDQVALAEILMIQATGHVNIVRLQISGRLPSVQCASKENSKFCLVGCPIALGKHLLEHCCRRKE